MRLATHVGMPHTNHIINNTKTNNHRVMELLMNS